MRNSIMNYLRARRWGLTSKPLKEGAFTVDIDGKPFDLAHSTFNTDWMAQLNIDTQTILELGSFDGGDGLRFANAFPKARIISVEADPDRFLIVQKTLENPTQRPSNRRSALLMGQLTGLPARLMARRMPKDRFSSKAKSTKRSFRLLSKPKNPDRLTASDWTVCARKWGSLILIFCIWILKVPKTLLCRDWATCARKQSFWKCATSFL